MDRCFATYQGIRCTRERGHDGKHWNTGAGPDGWWGTGPNAVEARSFADKREVRHEPFFDQWWRGDGDREE